MSFHDELIRTRPDELLREAARIRLAAQVRQACTALAFVLYFMLISEVGAVRATVITYINPAVAVALGAAVLGEPLTPVIVISFALILAGSVLATRPGPPRTVPGPRRASLRPSLRGRGSIPGNSPAQRDCAGAQLPNGVI